VVVTKNHDANLVADLIDLGAENFGENRDQEAAPKAIEVERLRPGKGTWHFVGQLQTNKVKSVLEYSSYLHSLDRDSLLKELEKRTIDRQIDLGVFLEVNLTSDPDRGGLAPERIAEFAEKTSHIKGLSLMGLMGVAGIGVDPERDFERMARFSAELQAIYPSAKGLSIGMSGDFEAAIAYGATHLRIGTAITGKRPS